MPRSPVEQEAWELQCYGCRSRELDAAASEMAFIPEKERHGMLAMSILSDAQEVIDRGDRNYARQLINRAKYIISTYWMEANRGV